MQRGRRNVLAALAGVGLAGACYWGLDASERWSVARGHRRALEGTPTCTGRIDAHEACGGAFLLVPIGGTFHDSQCVCVGPGAPVRWRDGRPAALATGQTVSVWCRSGPQAAVMPPRCEAELVVVESGEP